MRVYALPVDFRVIRPKSKPLILYYKKSKKFVIQDEKDCKVKGVTYIKFTMHTDIGEVDILEKLLDGYVDDSVKWANLIENWYKEAEEFGYKEIDK